MRLQWTAALAALLLVSALPAGASNLAGAPSPQHFRGVQIAALFGESDEEKAARLQHENDQDSQISDLTQRIHDLERALQQTTGQNEQLTQRVRELSQRIDKQQKDFDYKLCTLAAQQLGAGATTNADGNGLSCDAGASATQARLQRPLRCRAASRQVLLKPRRPRAERSARFRRAPRRKLRSGRSSTKR